MKYPRVRIKSNLLIRNSLSEPLSSLWGSDGVMASQERVDVVVELYRKAWSSYEKAIVEGMCRTLDLEFKQSIIDVHIAPWMPAISDPLLISVIYSEQKFVSLLTHELVHKLLTDNIKLPNYPEEHDLITDWYNLFGVGHSWQTIVHIPVHAVLKYLYLDVLDEPERLQQDIDECNKYDDLGYKLAWNYVEANDYYAILEQLRGLYDKIKLA